MSAKIKKNVLSFEMPFRPNYEMYDVALWGLGTVSTAIVYNYSGLPSLPFWIMEGLCVFKGLQSLPAGIELYRKQKNLSGRPLTFITLPQLIRKIEKHPDEQWIGYGFEWENRHAQLSSELLSMDQSLFRPKPDLLQLTWQKVQTVNRAVKYISKFKAPADQTPVQKSKSFLRYMNKFPVAPKKETPMGQAWIHGIEPDEKVLYQDLKHVEGHTLIVGTTGAGKTRLFDLLISQAILRGDAVIIIDPKGDHELASNARRACIAKSVADGRGANDRKFFFFNPAFPLKSARIDPLRNFSRVTEVASRIAALLPGEGQGASFKAFSWQALNAVAQGLMVCYDRPNIVKLKHYLESGTEGLIYQTIYCYGEKVIENFSEKFKDIETQLAKLKTPHKKAQGMVDFYRTAIAPSFPNSDLEGLISLFEHDAMHLSKMISVLLPTLAMLTSDTLSSLLSPDPSDINDERPYLDTSRMINDGCCTYIGLDSLTDSVVGSAIGSLILSDLTAVAGARYNYGVNNTPVSIFVDEASETLCDPLIQMLNKARGAKMRLFLATQTFADFAAKLGSPDKATQVLGNVNNIFALRVTDTATQEYITDKMPKTRIKIMSHTLNQTTSTDTPLSHSGVQGQTLQEEEADLFQPAMLGQLPNLEYLANLSGGLILKGRIPILVEEKQKETSVEEKHQTDAKKETRQIEQPKDKALSAQKPEKDKVLKLDSSNDDDTQIKLSDLNPPLEISVSDLKVTKEKENSRGHQ